MSKSLSLTISSVADEKFLVSENNFFEKIWHSNKVEDDPTIPLSAYTIEKVLFEIAKGGLLEIAKNEKRCESWTTGGLPYWSPSIKNNSKRNYIT